MHLFEYAECLIDARFIQDYSKQFDLKEIISCDINCTEMNQSSRVILLSK
jgi:hypothetical protein